MQPRPCSSMDSRRVVAMIPAMTLSAGEPFAGYTIVRPLGAGAMGEVYLAQHPRLPRREALKILQASISNDDSFRQRFIREADSIAALEHPHIVTVHDRGDTDGRLWIATQFVDGSDASQLLKDRYPGGMPADEVCAITTAIAAALDYAHSRGILHRDVKPANILLAEPDQEGNRLIYLADFGIARPVDDPAGLTATNFTFGTFAYAAPEQLMGKDLDGCADQYALAATAYHLLTGKPVYSDSNPVAVISQHLAEPPPPPSGVRAELAPFDAVFVRALAKKPEERFSRCQDFASALTAAAESSGSSYSASAPTQEAPVMAAVDATAKSVRPQRNVAVLIGASVLLLGAAGALLWHPWTTSRAPISAQATSAPPAPATSAPPTTSTATTAVVTSTTTITASAIPAPTAPSPLPQQPSTATAAPTAAGGQADEQGFLAAAGYLPMYVRGARNGGEAGLLAQGYKACAALDQNSNPLQAAYLVYPSGNTTDGRITDDGMNLMRISATNLCPRNEHLFYS